MYLVVGLGNPGSKYNKTRHNVGFDIIDLISSKYNMPINREKFKGICGDGIICGEKVIILKPYTFMNLSGESVREVADFYKIPNENIVIIHDDISLECGRLRIRAHGSAGGHNGIKSVIANLACDTFVRIKVGVGQPEGDLVNFVLGRFPEEDRNKVEKTFDTVVLAVETIIKEGTNEAMNKFNSFKAE
jgi:peptidyl-tRNA hydrolase, PTH1 family